MWFCVDEYFEVLSAFSFFDIGSQNNQQPFIFSRTVRNWGISSSTIWIQDTNSHVSSDVYKSWINGHIALIYKLNSKNSLVLYLGGTNDRDPFLVYGEEGVQREPISFSILHAYVSFSENSFWPLIQKIVASINLRRD